MNDRQLLHRWFGVLLLGGSALLALNLLPLHSPHRADPPVVHHEEGMEGPHHHGSGAITDQWEGSAQGVAYSERNHHIAGWAVVLMGLAELIHAMRFPAMSWTRLLLPGAMLFSAVFVTIWSDHDAWPIGSLTFVQTFFGPDIEIVQHKIYGLLALVVGSIEWFRRIERLTHAAWVAPLPLMAIVGGLMLFGHSHGVHPSAHKIAMHHAVMGITAVTAGSSKLLSGWFYQPSARTAGRWEMLWAGLLLFIGMELLTYSE